MTGVVAVAAHGRALVTEQSLLASFSCYVATGGRVGAASSYLHDDCCTTMSNADAKTASEE